MTASPDGGVESGDIPAGQREAYALATYRCYASYPLELRYTAPLSNDQTKLIFAYYRDELAPCLRDLGYEIPDASSEQEFVERYSSGTAWDPYASVVPGVASETQWQKVSAACPQMPPNLYG